MKKSISLLFTALILCTALSVPALAAEEAAPGKDSCYYPISVEEYTYGPLDELRIDKVYQLSLDDDPGGIPTEDFVRGGRLYYLLDMTKKDEVGVDTKPYIHTITQASDTNNMEAVLQQLDAEMEVTTEDGYTATAKYTGTTSSKYATGYTVSANYTGEVAKTGCDVVTYTATFGSVEAPAGSKTPDGSGASNPDTPKAPLNVAGLKKPLMIVGLVAVVAVGGVFVFKKIKERR